MATIRNKRKSAALNKQNCEEHPRNNQVQNSNVPRSQEDYITQFCEEIEGRITKKLSQEFSWTENGILVIEMYRGQSKNKKNVPNYKNHKKSKYRLSQNSTHVIPSSPLSSGLSGKVSLLTNLLH